MSKKPLVSVIVPTKNASAFLDRCLNSIARQTYKKIEIIVVDNHSKDRTKAIARSYASHIFTKGPERCSQLNYGASKAKGKYIYRVDQDFFVQPNVIKECVDKCEIEGFDCVAVHNTSDPTVSFWAKVRKFERDMYKGDSLIVGCRFWSRKAFFAVDGFDERMIACEDYDIHNRMLEKGFRIGRIQSEEVHLDEPRTLSEICRKSYEYGSSIRKIILNNRLKKQINPYRKVFLRNIDNFVYHPILAIGFLIMNIIKLLAFNSGRLKGDIACEKTYSFY